jgi:hypothetical protein
VAKKSRERRKRDAAKNSDEQKSNERHPIAIRPVPKKIGEDDDNLKRRGEWFRRRITSNDDQS